MPDEGDRGGKGMDKRLEALLWFLGLTFVGFMIVPPVLRAILG